MSQPEIAHVDAHHADHVAPSTAERIPLPRARAQISFTGSTTPVVVVMWLTKTTRVRGVMASDTRVRISAALAGGQGQGELLHHDPVALGAQVPGLLAARVLLVADQDLVPGP
jgi:hypothetical protein